MGENEKMVVTVFRSRLREAARRDYEPVAQRMWELASQMPGCLDVKSFTALDHERVTIVTFADRASHDAWRDHREHQAAQRRGVADFYDEYHIQVATVNVDHHFRRDDERDGPAEEVRHGLT